MLHRKRHATTHFPPAALSVEPTASPIRIDRGFRQFVAVIGSLVVCRGATMLFPCTISAPWGPSTNHWGSVSIQWTYQACKVWKWVHGNGLCAPDAGFQVFGLPDTPQPCQPCAPEPSALNVDPCSPPVCVYGSCVISRACAESE